MNFEKIGEEWLLQKKIRIKDSTLAKYEYIMKKYLFPKLKNMSIEELQNYNFNNFVNELKEKISTKSTRDILCVLKAILYYANDEYNYDFKMNTPEVKFTWNIFKLFKKL